MPPVRRRRRSPDIGDSRPSSGKRSSYAGLIRDFGGSGSLLRVELEPVIWRTARTAGLRKDGGADRFVLEPVDFASKGVRRLDRGRQPIADYPEGSFASSDRWHCCRRHYLIARTDWRYSQLGLSILLAARRNLHAICFPERWISQGSSRMAQLAIASRRWQPRRSADHVRSRRRATP